VLDVKLKHLDEYSAARNAVADYYDAALSDIEGVVIPKRADYSSHVFHQYTIRVTNGRRDELKAALNEKGVPSMIYYPVPLHLQKTYLKDGFGKGSFPVSEMLCQQVLSLPIHTEMNDEQLEYIVGAVREIMQ